eukprot:scaffold161311_cov28-Tisochrysis_lutea.AAC.3
MAVLQQVRAHLPADVGRLATPVGHVAERSGAHLTVRDVALLERRHLVVEQPDRVASHRQQARLAHSGRDLVVGLACVVLVAKERECGGQLARPADVVLHHPHLLHVALLELARVGHVPRDAGQVAQVGEPDGLARVGPPDLVRLGQQAGEVALDRALRDERHRVVAHRAHEHRVCLLVLLLVEPRVPLAPAGEPVGRDASAADLRDAVEVRRARELRARARHPCGKRGRDRHRADRVHHRKRGRRRLGARSGRSFDGSVRRARGVPNLAHAGVRRSHERRHERADARTALCELPHGALPMPLVRPVVLIAECGALLGGVCMSKPEFLPHRLDVPTHSLREQSASERVERSAGAEGTRTAFTRTAGGSGA